MISRRRGRDREDHAEVRYQAARSAAASNEADICGLTCFAAAQERRSGCQKHNRTPHPGCRILEK